MDVRHLVEGADGGDDLVDRGAELGGVGGQGVGLDDDDLAEAVLVEVEGPVDDLVGAGRTRRRPSRSCRCVVIGEKMLSENATTTKASHPKMAVLRCAALQRPMRAAMFFE